MNPIQKVIVLGGGTAGLVTALTLKHTFRHLDVQVIRGPEIGIIGVGEGTTPAFCSRRESWGSDSCGGPREEFHFR